MSGGYSFGNCSLSCKQLIQKWQPSDNRSVVVVAAQILHSLNARRNLLARQRHLVSDTCEISNWLIIARTEPSFAIATGCIFSIRFRIRTILNSRSRAHLPFARSFLSICEILRSARSERIEPCTCSRIPDVLLNSLTLGHLNPT